jgi:hypothetical protein
MTGTDSVLGTFAIVELFGHTKIAGYVSEEMVVGVPMLQVAVPGSGDRSPFLRYYGAKTIFSITPVSEETVNRFLDCYRPDQSPVYVPAEPILIRAGSIEDAQDTGDDELGDALDDEFPF